MKNNVDILIIDSDPDSARRTKDLLIKKSYTVKESMNAVNKTQAIESIIFDEPKIILMDVIGTGFNSIEVFRNLAKIKIYSLIIIYTNETSNLTDYIKKMSFVFHVVLKTSSQAALLDCIEKGIHFFEKGKNLSNTIEEAERGYKKELDWILWKEKKSLDINKNDGKQVFETIIHSIFQGMGIGSLLSTVDLMKMSGKKDDGKVTIKEKMFSVLVKNADAVHELKARLDNLVALMSRKYTNEIINLKDMNKIITDEIVQTKAFSLIKEHRIKFTPFRSDENFIANSDFLAVTIRELLTNAYKYSPPKSTIYISKGFSTEGISFMVINEIEILKRGLSGIPPEYEFEIFEPFFKLNKLNDERFFSEEIGFGVGLSLIYNGVVSFGGQVHANEVIDYVTADSPTRKVIVEIIFPLYEIM